MKNTIVFLAIVILVMLITGTPTLSSANQKEFKVNNTLLQFIEGGECDADGTFRIIHVVFKGGKNVNVISDVKISTVLFKIDNGVVGEGSVDKFKIIYPQKEVFINNKIKCSEGTSKIEPLALKLDDQKFDSHSEIRIDGESLGMVTSDNSNFKVYSETKTKNTFLIITGADACDSEGAFRLVHVNNKEEDNGKVMTEVDIVSAFFTTYEIVGKALTEVKFENDIIDFQKKIPVNNPIDCFDSTIWSDEEFDFTINPSGQGNLNLPPI